MESRKIFWIISHTSEINETAFHSLQNYLGASALGRLDQIVQTITGNPSPSRVDAEKWIEHPGLYGVMLIIEREGLTDPEYCKWAEWCRKKVFRQDDFRLFIYLNGMTIREFNDLADQGAGTMGEDPDAGKELLFNLRETVQIEEYDEIDRCCKNIVTYTVRFNEICNAIHWRKLRTTVSILLGWAGAIVQLGSLAITALILVLMLAQKINVLDPLGLPMKEMIGFAAGLLIFPMFTVPLFLVGKGTQVINSMLGSEKKYGIYSIFFCLLGPGIFEIPNRLGIGIPIFILGICFGGVFDIARRNGRQAERLAIALTKETATPRGEGLADSLAAIIQGCHSNPWTCPMIPVTKAKVFISYTHSSEWAQQVVQNLADQLQRVGAVCFLDRTGIEPGTSWRRTLHHKLAEANVFIAVIDRISIRKEWTAAEIETALTGKKLTGLPDVIVLKEADFSKVEIQKSLPVFSAILSTPVKPGRGQARLLKVTENTIPILAVGLKDHKYRSVAVLPEVVGYFLILLNMIPGMIGPLGTLAGFGGWVIALWQIFGGLNPNALLSGVGLFVAAYFLTAFWFGFVIKLWVSSRYEIRHQTPRELSLVNLTAAAGLALLLRLWLNDVSIVQTGWAILFSVIGWASANSFIQRVSDVRKDFIKPSMG